MNLSSSQASGLHSRRTRAAAIAISVCLGTTLVACGSSDSNSSSSGSEKVGVSLILKTLSNPYFVSMEKDAKTQAAKDKVSLTVAAGTSDGDTQTQITAIDNAVSRGDKGILITTNGDAVNTALKRAKQAGLFVIALDTAPNPASVADITYATDNEQAGRLDGQYAAAALDGKPAVIAMLDLFNNQVVSVDIDRDHGFLEGMGIDPGSKTENGKEAKSGKYTGGKGGTYTIACHQPTQGAIDGGRTAMENCLSANPDINVVYAINEPVRRGRVQRAEGGGQGEGRRDLRDRRQLLGPEERHQRQVRRRRRAVPGQDGGARRQLHREAGPRRQQAQRDQREVVLRHRHRAGRRQVHRGSEGPVPVAGRFRLLGQLTRSAGWAAGTAPAAHPHRTSP